MDITAEAPSLVLVGTVKIQKVIGCLRWRLTTLVYHYYSKYVNLFTFKSLC